MKLRSIFALVALVAWSTVAQAINPGDVIDTITTKDGRTYEKCRIFKVDPDGVMFSHKLGGAKILFADMTEASRQRLGYSPEREAAYYKKLAEKHAVEMRLEAIDMSAAPAAEVVPPNPNDYAAAYGPSNTLGYDMSYPGWGYPLYPNLSPNGYAPNGYNSGAPYVLRPGNTTLVPKNVTPHIVNLISRPQAHTPAGPPPNAHFFAVPPLGVSHH